MTEPGDDVVVRVGWELDSTAGITAEIAAARLRMQNALKPLTLELQSDPAAVRSRLSAILAATNEVADAELAVAKKSARDEIAATGSRVRRQIAAAKTIGQAQIRATNEVTQAQIEAAKKVERIQITAIKRAEEAIKRAAKRAQAAQDEASEREELAASRSDTGKAPASLLAANDRASAARKAETVELKEQLKIAQERLVITRAIIAGGTTAAKSTPKATPKASPAPKTTPTPKVASEPEVAPATVAHQQAAAAKKAERAEVVRIRAEARKQLTADRKLKREEIKEAEATREPSTSSVAKPVSRAKARTADEKIIAKDKAKAKRDAVQAKITADRLAANEEAAVAKAIAEGPEAVAAKAQRDKDIATAKALIARINAEAAAEVKTAEPEPSAPPRRETRLGTRRKAAEAKKAADDEANAIATRAQAAAEREKTASELAASNQKITTAKAIAARAAEQETLRANRAAYLKSDEYLQLAREKGEELTTADKLAAAVGKDEPFTTNESDKIARDKAIADSLDASKKLTEDDTLAAEDKKAKRAEAALERARKAEREDFKARQEDFKADAAGREKDIASRITSSRKLTETNRVADKERRAEHAEAARIRAERRKQLLADAKLRRQEDIEAKKLAEPIKPAKPVSKVKVRTEEEKLRAKQKRDEAQDKATAARLKTNEEAATAKAIADGPAAVAAKAKRDADTAAIRAVEARAKALAKAEATEPEPIVLPEITRTPRETRQEKRRKAAAAKKAADDKASNIANKLRAANEKEIAASELNAASKNATAERAIAARKVEHAALAANRAAYLQSDEYLQLPREEGDEPTTADKLAAAIKRNRPYTTREPSKTDEPDTTEESSKTARDEGYTAHDLEVALEAIRKAGQEDFKASAADREKDIVDRVATSKKLTETNRLAAKDRKTEREQAVEDRKAGYAEATAARKTKRDRARDYREEHGTNWVTKNLNFDERAKTAEAKEKARIDRQKRAAVGEFNQTKRVEAARAQAIKQQDALDKIRLSPKGLIGTTQSISARTRVIKAAEREETKAKDKVERERIASDKKKYSELQKLLDPAIFDKLPKHLKARVTELNHELQESLRIDELSIGIKRFSTVIKDKNKAAREQAAADKVEYNALQKLLHPTVLATLSEVVQKRVKERNLELQKSLQISPLSIDAERTSTRAKDSKRLADKAAREQLTADKKEYRELEKLLDPTVFDKLTDTYKNYVRTRAVELQKVLRIDTSTLSAKIITDKIKRDAAGGDELTRKGEAAAKARLKANQRFFKLFSPFDFSPWVPSVRKARSAGFLGGGGRIAGGFRGGMFDSGGGGGGGGGGGDRVGSGGGGRAYNLPFVSQALPRRYAAAAVATGVAAGAGIGLPLLGAAAAAIPVLTGAIPLFGVINSLLKENKELASAAATGWTDFKAATQGAALKVIAEGVDAIHVGLTALTPLTNTVAEGFAVVGQQWQTALAGPGFTKIFAGFENIAGSGVIETVNKALINVTEGVGHLIIAFAPLISIVATGLASVGVSFNKWATSLSGSAGLERFIEYVKSNGHILFDTLKSLGSALVNIAPALAEIGHIALIVVQQIVELFELVSRNPFGRAAIEILLAASAFKAFTAALRASAISSLIVKLVELTKATLAARAAAKALEASKAAFAGLDAAAAAGATTAASRGAGRGAGLATASPLVAIAPILAASAAVVGLGYAVAKLREEMTYFISDKLGFGAFASTVQQGFASLLGLVTRLVPGLSGVVDQFLRMGQHGTFLNELPRATNKAAEAQHELGLEAQYAEAKLGKYADAANVASHAMDVLADAQKGAKDALTKLDDAESARDRKNAVSDAKTAVSDARTAKSKVPAQNAKDLENAEFNYTRSLADKVVAYDRADQLIVDAEKRVVDAHKAVKDALTDLTQARKDAIQQVKDLAEAESDAVLSKEGAEIGLIRARISRDKVYADPGSDALDRRQADLDLKLAEDALSDSSKDLTDAQIAAAAAKKAGVEGNPTVIAAVDALTAARNEETTALRDQKRVAIEASQIKVDADRAVTVADDARTTTREANAARIVAANTAERVATEQLHDAYVAIDRAVLELKDRNIKVTVSAALDGTFDDSGNFIPNPPKPTVAPERGRARATGGPIDGPGTETSDSIPTMLSKGEHVWSAREVRKAGGHNVLARMRAYVRHLAEGGAIDTIMNEGLGTIAPLSMADLTFNGAELKRTFTRASLNVGGQSAAAVANSIRGVKNKIKIPAVKNPYVIHGIIKNDDILGPWAQFAEGGPVGAFSSQVIVPDSRSTGSNSTPVINVAPPNLEVHVFLDGKEITGIVNVRIKNRERELANTLFSGGSGWS